MNTEIKNVSELVEAFGGTGTFAEWADVGPSCVSNWKAEGYIPRGYHLRIYLEANARGLKVSPKLFELEEWPTGAAKARPKKRADVRPAA